MSNQDELDQSKKKVSFKNKYENENIKTVLKELYTQIVKKDSEPAERIQLALASLTKYPIQITSGAGCIILHGFNKQLCEYVEEHLFKKQEILCCIHDKEPTIKSCIKATQTPNDMHVKKVDEGVQENSKQLNVQPAAKRMKKNNQGIHPVYLETDNKINAVLIALHNQLLEYPSRPALNMKELMIKVQRYCTNKIYDWSFVKTLERKPTYLKCEVQGGIKMYTLSDLGIKKANGFVPYHESNYKHNTNNRVPLYYDPFIGQAPLNSANDFPLFIEMTPGSYEIVMLVDKNEPEMLSKGNDLINIESRSLKIGDIIWVARNKIDSQELVLPFIIERKRMDDFASSIKDGRFHEQKFRLRKCGVRNVVYLVEDHEGNKRCGLPMATLNQAKINTRVQDGFMVHHTESLKNTKKFLNMMTIKLTNELEYHHLQGKHLRGTNTDIGGQELMTFEYFNASSSKTKPLTVRELFVKMLLQLKGLSVEKALAITKAYNSPLALMEAYDNCSVDEGELLLANLRFNDFTPRVSPTISKILYHLFSRKFTPIQAIDPSCYDEQDF